MAVLDAPREFGERLWSVDDGEVELVVLLAMSPLVGYFREELLAGGDEEAEERGGEEGAPKLPG